MKWALIFALLGACSFSLAEEAHIHWSEGEHLELGDLAAQKICADLRMKESECPLFSIPRRDHKIRFSYGEIVTSGDFYRSASDMYEDQRTGILSVLKCARKQQRTHPEQNKRDDVHYPSCNLPAFFSIPGYLEIVTTTDDHFGWHNMKAYLKYHGRALTKAQEAFHKGKDSPRTHRRLLQQALAYNAFADHFLSDGFASGHIRVPRAQVKRWARSHLSGLFKSFRGDLLTWLLHDRESQNFHTNREEGLPVQNSLRTQWTTRGDQQLHKANMPQDPARELPLLAMMVSIQEILETARTGVISEGVYKATLLVPFHVGTPMIQKFTPDYQGMSKRHFIKSFYAILPFYERWVHKKDDLQRMLVALPRIFEKFRFDVRRDIQKIPELQKRLPQEYLKAYSEVE